MTAKLRQDLIGVQNATPDPDANSNRLSSAKRGCSRANLWSWRHCVSERIERGPPKRFWRQGHLGSQANNRQIEVRYLGFTDGIAHFARRDTKILTNETTVNRSGTVFGSVGGKTIILSGVGAGPIIQALEPDEFPLKVDVATDPIFIIDGEFLKVIQAGTNRVILDLPEKSPR